ncbi:DUF3667 domain-containing protein [Psychroserpens ponticola]|uniref:DUF3667 domain-containing protein n=1 Tax=Psychroserpens ponticola TaxID=2932268 RepID=A0ABY7RVT6_9FLAO|nr:DUF3667 domain-containing protein [Psychroserpens ponticola]WCO00361.1 DUF3667 domain-containing protein [Psychroserpens ponticola]
MSDESLVTTNEPLPCQNCDSILEEGFEFCPHCGQKTNDALTIGVLFYNTISNYFSFDARFLKSFAPLMFRPGYLAEKFIQGKRLLYLHPAQMYLFVSVIFFFIVSFSTRDLVQEANKINEKVAKSEFVSEQKDSLNQATDSIKIEKIMKPLKDNQQIIGLEDSDLKMADSLIKLETANPKNMNTSWDFDKRKVDSLVASGADNEVIYKEMGMSEDPSFLERRLYTRMLSLAKGQGAGSIVQAFFDSIPISMFFLLPFFALILKVFYYNKGKYVHHLVFSFYFFSFLFTVFSVLFGLNNFFEIESWINWLIAISTYFYFLIALIRFYRQHWFLTWVKSGIITFVFILFVIPTAIGLLAAFSFFTS